MPLWLIAALSVAFLYASVNILDKLVMTNFIDNPVVYVMLEALLGLIPALLLFVAGLVHVYSTGSTVLGIFTGILLAAFSLLYAASLGFGDVAVIAMILQLSVVVNVVVGLIFFTERYAFPAFIGMGLITCAAVGASWATSFPESGLVSNWKWGANSWVRLFGLLIPAILLGAASFALQKYVGRTVDLTTLFALGRIGACAMVAPLLLSRRTRADLKVFFSRSVGNRSLKAVAVVAASQTLNIIAIFLGLFAYVNGPVALVATAGAIQPMFVLLLSLLLSIAFRSATLRASRRRQDWIVHLVLALLIVIGSVLIHGT